MKNKLLLLLFLLGVVFLLSAQESEVLISTSHTFYCFPHFRKEEN